MRLDGIELYRIELTLRRPVGTAAGEHLRRPLVVVRVAGEGAEGWGECGALAGGTGVDAGVDAVWQALVEQAVPRVLAAAAKRGDELPAASDVHAATAGTGKNGAGTSQDRLAAAAIEMAVLDADLSTSGVSLADWLGAGRAAVAVGALAGIPADRSAAALAESVDELVDRGYARVRLKIAPGWDRVPVRAVRERHPALALQVDANASYRWGSGGDDCVDRLVALDPFGLSCIEQPLPPEDLAAHAALARMLVTPVCLDESLWSPTRVRQALQAGACEVACLKPARLGGMAAARRALASCEDAGVPAFVGGFFEAGLGRSANAALAALDGFRLPGDLTAPAEYLEEDPFAYPAVRSGTVAVPKGPGICSPPDRAVLQRLTSVRRWFPATR